MITYSDYLEAKEQGKSFNRFVTDCFHLSNAELSDAGLSNANLMDTDLSHANLSNANLHRAELSGANLSDANLSGANLSRANLYCADLGRANLSRANLNGANLSRAELSNANLSGANLRGANLNGTTGVFASYGIGDVNRLVFAYVYDGEIRVQAGCRNATIPELKEAVKEDYEPHTKGYKQYMLFCDLAEISLTEYLVNEEL